MFDSIRASFGTDGTKNAVHGSDSPISAEREIALIFGDAAGKIQAALSRTGSKALLAASLRGSKEKLEVEQAAAVAPPAPAPEGNTAS
jgi:hypothetical protein